MILFMQKLLFLALLFPLITVAQNSKIFQNSINVYPDSVWENVTNPGQYGWDVDKLKQLRTFVVDSAHTTGMLVVQSGRILFEFGDVQELSYLASCRKSVLSMLYGPFIENGIIKLNTTVEQLGLDDVGGLLQIEKKATIKDLLTARSGVYHPASNEGDASAMAPGRGSVQPGSFWLYNNWDFNIAGYILEQQTGKNIYELIDSILAKPLCMQDWRKETQRKTGDTTRSKYLAYHMWFSNRDMARLGYLMLRKGKWKEKQVLPASWITTTTMPVTTYKEAEQNKTAYFKFGYGYLWWVWDAPDNNGIYEGAYTASGAFGQFITIIPKLDLVIAHKTKYEYQRQVPTDVYLKILDKLIAAQR
jgi:CubicO group peptidase (beta-lactamase class C family)